MMQPQLMARPENFLERVNEPAAFAADWTLKARVNCDAGARANGNAVGETAPLN